MKLKFYPTAILYLCAATALSGCSALVGSVTQSFAEDLSAAILNNEDLAMVRDGAPSYLILVDSLVARSPQDAFMLQQSAKLHSAYAAAFVSDETRAKLLHDKAKTQALASACYGLKDACNLDSRPFAEFDNWLARQKTAQVPAMYDLGTTWASWIQANSDDFSAIAELARVKALMARTAELDPDYDSGGVFLYLGVFETLFPPAMGGKPEIGRAHFEQAIERSNGTNLLAKVMYAEQYARLVFDRELHDRLLTQVIEAPALAPGLTLMNTVAKEQARQLLDSADDYF
ncbi:MAG: TRAP transporter TatT component family protein [Pseudomonadaceae bacterium]|nr:TRAP transporter TatT component family protein [Pseudomonadaceae bacterium]